MKAFALTTAALILLSSVPFAQEVSMKLTSPAFTENAPIPAQYTCQGRDINPELGIDDIPSGTKTLALIVDDPDAPGKAWVHWVVFNIPVTARIKEDSIPGVEGYNDFGRNHWGGPCPPSGVHRYYFKLYALDTALDLKEGASKKELEAAMKSRILAEAVLMGVYKKK